MENKAQTNTRAVYISDYHAGLLERIVGRMCYESGGKATLKAAMESLIMEKAYDWDILDSKKG